MALDLYVNFERYSNNSSFYRVAQPALTDVPFTIKLIDEGLADNLTFLGYSAEYSINKRPYQQMTPNNYGVIQTNVTFNTSSPCVCAISVKVYKDGVVLANTFEMSAVILAEFPVVDMLLYPGSYINESTRELVLLNSSNYRDSKGPYFYGEGHTETMFLSCNVFQNLNNQFTTKWLVGNNPKDGFVNSNIIVNELTPFTASVGISSSSNDNKSYPVNVRILNEKISLTGPIITYDDTTGVPSYYPFFASTANVSGRDLNGTFKGNIKVLPYPEKQQFTLVSPFSSSNLFLPLDGTPQIFRAITYNPRDAILDTLLTEKFVGTRWSLEATSNGGEWLITTPLLSSILAYEFKLNYDDVVNDLMLPTFKASPETVTTVTLYVSSYKDVKINLSPYDWQTKRIHQTKQEKVTIGSVPYVKLFIPNYYYLKGQEVPITIVQAPSAYPFKYDSVIISSDHSNNPLILSGTALSGVMYFQQSGPVDLKITTYVTNPNNNNKQYSSFTYDNILEVVNYFDQVEENYFLTETTPLTLTYNSYPRLSPNEWAIADNVNSIIEKLYKTIEEIDQYTRLYVNKSKLFAWLGPIPRFTSAAESNTSNSISTPIYTWDDLFCTTNEEEKVYSWQAFECYSPNKSLTWENQGWLKTHTETDPSCIQKHCLDWKWKARKQGAGNTNVTWKLTKYKQSLQKRWAYEKCELDTEILNCNKPSWRISSIDPLHFPVSYGSNLFRCRLADAKPHSNNDLLLSVTPTEINLLKNNYLGTLAIRRGIADDVFSFQNIVGSAITSEGRIVVLDSVLCKVCIYDVVTDSAQLKLFNSWGSFGAPENPRGFNKPSDVYVDQYNSVWITDTGNKRIKKLNLLGKNTLIVYHEKFETNPPLSVCMDSKSNLHCLTSSFVLVFDQYGNYLREYDLPTTLINVKKINSSYNQEAVYITHQTGVTKFFRTGKIAYHVIQNYVCADGVELTNFNSVSQDKYRNLYVTVGDKLLKIADLQHIVELKAPLTNLYWNISELKIHKEEYIQPWVYLKSFHRLWDNIELIRSSLFYETNGCRVYRPAIFKKEDLIIGQNEIVTNAVINRLSEQLWTNLSSLFEYFSLDCKNLK
jgi:hypothetical protein